MLNAFSNFCLWLCMSLLGFGNEYRKNKLSRDAVLTAESNAYGKLTAPNKALVWFADGKITQAKAARRKYWQNMDAKPWAKLYKELALCDAELTRVMSSERKMPGYFQKRVRAEMARL